MDSLNFSEAFMSDDEDFEESVPITLPETRTLWELDKKCSVCLINFNIPGLAHTQKSKCLFCYRGVCTRCLTFEHLHPETQKSEKMCKICKNERYQLRLIKRKTEEARLERAQVQLEVELAQNEKEQLAQTRKTLQKKIHELKLTSTSTEGEITETLQYQKEFEKNLKIRLSYSQLSTSELDEKSQTLQHTLENCLNELRELKESLSAKEKIEKELKEEINSKKEKSLVILQHHKRKESESMQVESVVSCLKEEISELEMRLAEVTPKIFDMEQTLDGTTARQSLQGSVLLSLNEKICIFKSLKLEDEPEITEDDKEILIKEQEKLKKYDQIIEKLFERVDMLKKNQNRLATENSEASEKPEILYKQSDVLKSTDFNKPLRTEHRSDSACKNCLIS